MSFQDYWALGVWYEYYGRKIGYSNLYIVEHGHDPAYRELFPKAHFLTYPRDLAQQDFDQDRHDFLDKVQTKLTAAYDYCIRSDADEIVVYDTERHASLHSVINSCNGFSVATGVNLVEGAGVTFEGPSGIELPRRAVFDSRYSKAWVTDGSRFLRQHGVSALSSETFDLGAHLADGVYLLHLKYANAIALDIQSLAREDVVVNGADRKKGGAWANDKTYEKKIKRKATGDVVRFEDAARDALAVALEKTKPITKSGVYRVQRGFWQGPTDLPHTVIKSLQDG